MLSKQDNGFLLMCKVCLPIFLFHSPLNLLLMFYICYGTELVIVTNCCVIAAQEKRLDLRRSDLKNPLKINFAAVFELIKLMN